MFECLGTVFIKMSDSVCYIFVKRKTIFDIVMPLFFGCCGKSTLGSVGGGLLDSYRELPTYPHRGIKS